MLLFEVLLHVRVLVLDVQARLHAVSDHPCPVPVGGRRRRARDAQRKQEADSIGTSEVQILANDGFEEMAALHGAIEDLRQTDLELADRDAMVVTGGAVRGRHRPRQTLRPAIEEGLDVGRAERIAGGLHGGWIGTRQKPIVETFEGDPVATEALLDPFVAVETEFHGIRQIRPDLEERRPPRGVLHIEVVLIDVDPLARKVERDGLARPAALLGFEGPHLLLGDSEDHDPLVSGEAPAIARHKGVLVLPRLERHLRNGVMRDELVHTGDKSIEHRAEQRGRRNRVPAMLVEKIAEAA